MISLVRSETSKLMSVRAIVILVLVAILGTWPMAWSNAVPVPEELSGSDLLFSSTPIPAEYQGFDMAGFGYVLVVAVAALWAASEYGGGNQIRTTFLATPKRLRVFVVKAVLLTILVSLTGLLTMTGTIVITHLVGDSGVHSWTLSPAIWTNIGGVTVAWTLTALITFSIGTLARTAILPLIAVVPLVIGIGEFFAGIWDGAKYLPIAAGASLYSDPETGTYLDPAIGGVVQASWAAAFLLLGAIAFTRRDL